MPNCTEHEDCDLVCAVCGSYYCGGREEGNHPDSHADHPKDPWIHIPRPDMPDDPEAYYNERAEEML